MFFQVCKVINNSLNYRSRQLIFNHFNTSEYSDSLWADERPSNKPCPDPFLVLGTVLD
jgi:hypothetical protein